MTVGLQKFSSRVSVFTGGVLTVVGFLLTAFTTDLAMFYFGQGFLLGNPSLITIFDQVISLPHLSLLNFKHSLIMTCLFRNIFTMLKYCIIEIYANA
jgi:hypothetical protein